MALVEILHPELNFIFDSSIHFFWDLYVFYFVEILENLADCSI